MWGRGVSPGRVQSKNEGANVTKGGYGGVIILGKVCHEINFYYILFVL